MASLVATAHQPAYLPWTGYFARMLEADVFVLLDHVQYEQRGWQNRNVIRAAHGALMLTVPIRSRGRLGQALIDTEIATTQRWQPAHWRSILLNYRSSAHFHSYHDIFEPVYLDTSWTRLVELNVALIEKIRSILGIHMPVVRSSDLNLTGRSTEMLGQMCATVGAATIVTGEGATDYLDVDTLARYGVTHQLSRFKHPQYPQRRRPFMPDMSILDMLFNCGPATPRLLRASVGNGRETGSRRGSRAPARRSARAWTGTKARA